MRKDLIVNGYTISGDRRKIQLDRVMHLLGLTYWANQRSEQTVARSIRHSLPFGVYDPEGRQVGFARLVTDYATHFYLADVILDPEARGKGLGLALVRYATEDGRVARCMGMLMTQTAHGLYEKIGFTRAGENLMRRKPAKS